MLAHLLDLLAYQQAAVVGAHRHQTNPAASKVENLQRFGKLDQPADVVGNDSNSRSGVRWAETTRASKISGISNDIHEIEAAAADGHHRALLAHKAFCYQVRKNIGAYVAAMGGIDVLAFTGDIGETSATVRSLACQGLGYMGIKLDEEKNRQLGKLGSHAVISTDDSPVTILVVANDDERLVAWEATRAIERNQLLLEAKADAFWCTRPFSS